MNYLLSEAEEPIRQALERLLEKEEDRHPFVVIEKVGRPDIFVQFAGSRKRELVFDVPRLRIVLEKTTPELGARRAVTTLATPFGIRPDERVLVREEEDQDPPGRGLLFWKKLFA
jgi:hypothetical protein